jgi:DNA-binding response OmpR family regulator
LFLTHAEDVESRLHGLNVGADLFLVKPFRAGAHAARARAPDGTVEDQGSRGQSAAIELADGVFARGTLDDAPRDAVDLLRQILAWKSG